VRQHPFQEKIEWTLENIISDKKHSRRGVEWS
jgi:hypothetical protein